MFGKCNLKNKYKYKWNENIIEKIKQRNDAFTPQLNEVYLLVTQVVGIVNVS